MHAIFYTIELSSRDLVRSLFCLIERYRAILCSVDNQSWDCYTRQVDLLLPLMMVINVTIPSIRIDGWTNKDFCYFSQGLKSVWVICNFFCEGLLLIFTDKLILQQETNDLLGVGLSCLFHPFAQKSRRNCHLPLPLHLLFKVWMSEISSDSYFSH